VSELPVILIVEDEYPLQGIVEDALTEGGFESDILSSGEEALTLFKGKTKNYKALVTDVNLKGRINGWEVARQIREIDPAFPIIYMTGGLRIDGHREVCPTASFSKSHLRQRSLSPPFRLFSTRVRRHRETAVGYKRRRPQLGGRAEAAHDCADGAGRSTRR